MTTVSVTEAAQILVKEGILKGKYADQAVRRLIKLGELRAQKPPLNQPKLGHQVYEESLYEYIEVGKMGVSELRKELLKTRSELAKLKANVSEGRLIKQPNGRYELNGTELTSGYPIDVFYNGEWIPSRIEYATIEQDYYVYDLGPEKKIEGMTARLVE